MISGLLKQHSGGMSRVVWSSISRGSVLFLLGWIWPLFNHHGLYAQADFNEYRYSHQFSVEACKEDFKVFRTLLEQKHPNLYLYTSQDEINRVLDSLEATINYPFNSIHFYNTITWMLPVIRDGHTHIFPDADFAKENEEPTLYFPMQVHWEGQRLFIIRDYSGSGIQPGTEIMLINEVNVERIYDILMHRQIRDGYNETYPEWILEKYFAAYYSFHFGNPPGYILNTVNADRSLGTVHVRGISQDSITYYRSSRYHEPTKEDLYGQGIKLQVDRALKSATLTIRDFHQDALQEKYHQSFKPALTSCFRTIFSQQIDHLILDLRDNQGGDTENGVLLLSYLLDTAFQYIQSYEKVDPTLYHVPIARLEPVKGASTGYQPCARKHFDGRLYVLINGGSFSNTGIVCSVLDTHKRCRFIGEETGGNPGVFSGGGKNVTLPNTKTVVLIPELRYNIRSRMYNTGLGITPDYPVQPTTTDLIAGRDTVMEFTRQLIQQGKY